MKRQRYYYLLRPPGPGCQPKGSTELHAYDYKIYNPNAGREVWGWVEYAHELSDAEIEAYDLAKGVRLHVDVGKVEVWNVGASRREQAVKMSEEVMEVFAIIDQHDITPETAYDIFRECADVITATCNLVSMVARIAGAESGSLDFTGYMERCAEVQRERGRL